MFASTSELKARTCTSLVVRIYKVSIALATNHFDQIGLDCDFERVIFQFKESTTTTVDTQRLIEIEWFALTPLDIGNSLVTI
jgi:hypothetical protein